MIVFDEKQLKPCPFCGGKGETDKYAPNMAYCIDGLSGADNDDKKCHNDAILSIEDWNTRPIEDAKDAEIARLRAALEKYASKKNWQRSFYRTEINDLWMPNEDGWIIAEDALKGGEHEHTQTG